MKTISLLLGVLSIISCSSQKKLINLYQNTIIVVENSDKRLIDSIEKEWWHKDIFVNKIPGISLEKLYDQFDFNKESNNIVVAVLDTGMDINHEELKNCIWLNTDEIPANGIDDDKNGYIDDVNGWNFLADEKGETTVFANYEFVRVLRKKGFFEKDFDENTMDSITKFAYAQYKDHLAELEDDKSFYKNHLKEVNSAKVALKPYFPEELYTLEKLSKIDTIQHKHLRKHVVKLYNTIDWEMDESWEKEFGSYIKQTEEYSLNSSYDDNKIFKNDLAKWNYGNNDVVGDLSIETHGTMVAGLIAANRENNKGIKGVCSNVKIMPVRVIPSGDEHDEDVALAIRYAVDNGARIINMSFGKKISPNKELVLDAIKYAAEKNVLLVHAAGNESTDIDRMNFYPNDTDETKKAYVDNFINVGALNYKLNHKLPAYFSNYGQNNVDIFAPGYNIYTTSPHNSYILQDGTSLAAPIVSGIATILLSNFPDLTAKNLKKIIMNSGHSYDLMVTIPGRKGEKVPFSELSKSGGVVNAYNALLMAEEISKK